MNCFNQPTAKRAARFISIVCILLFVCRAQSQVAKAYDSVFIDGLKKEVLVSVAAKEKKRAGDGRHDL